jgi:hypothetical protein
VARDEIERFVRAGFASGAERQKIAPFFENRRQANA